MSPDDFADAVSGTGIDGERDLPTAYPGAPEKKAAAKKWRVKYAKFSLDEKGNEALEAIMDGCVRGENQLLQEKWSNSKDGDVFVTVKYMVPADAAAGGGFKPEDIRGTRRQRKALLAQDEKP